jgi:hypothetical protein
MDESSSRSGNPICWPRGVYWSHGAFASRLELALAKTLFLSGFLDIRHKKISFDVRAESTPTQLRTLCGEALQVH